MTVQQEQAGLRELATIALPGTEAPGTAWDLYNQMIAGTSPRACSCVIIAWG